MQPAVLVTPRLRLDPPGPGDVDAVTEACQDEAVQRWTTVPSPYGRADAEAFLTRVVPRGWAEGTDRTWAIREREGGPLLGVIGARQALGDVGYWLAAGARGRGILTEALDAVVTHLLATGEQSIHWECLVGNIASARAARRIGFRFTGVGPGRVPGRDGSPALSWRAELSPGDERTPPAGWPAELDRPADT